MDTKGKKRLWFCSDYGLENKSIIKKLNESDEKYYIVTHDKETKWENLTPLFQRKIMRESLKGSIIYGIGLNGTLPGTNIANLSFENEKHGKDISVLEQVLGIIGKRMSLDEQFIAAYVSNGISGVNSIAKKLRLKENEAENIAENILIRNHQAIGISIEREAELAQKVNTSMQKMKTDYETTVAIDDLLNSEYDLVRN